MRNLTEGKSIHRFISGVQYTHCEQVIPITANRIGDIESERGLPAFVPANKNTVQPHIGKVIHRPESKQAPLIPLG